MSRSPVSAVSEYAAAGWERPPATLSLPADEVHVWQAVLDPDASAVAGFREFLSEDEIDRADRFHFERDRHRFAAARGILRELLARYLDRQPARLRFAYNENGKPALADADRGVIEFNLSHSHDRVLYAFTLRGPVGVDVERIRQAALDAKIAERFFSNKEAAALAALPEADRCRAFFLHWAAKEAYIKARGEGLASGLQHVELQLGPTARDVQLLPTGATEQAGSWSVQIVNLGPTYAAALATEGAPRRVRRFVYRRAPSTAA